MEWRWFGSKGRVQRWNCDHLEARGGLRDELAVVWRQGEASGMEFFSFGGNASETEYRSFGSKMMLQKWNGESLKARECGRDER